MPYENQAYYKWDQGALCENQVYYVRTKSVIGKPGVLCEIRERYIWIRLILFANNKFEQCYMRTRRRTNIFYETKELFENKESFILWEQARRNTSKNKELFMRTRGLLYIMKTRNTNKSKELTRSSVSEENSG